MLPRVRGLHISSKRLGALDVKLLIKLKADNYMTSSTGLNVVSSSDFVAVSQIDELSMVVSSIAVFSSHDEISVISSICRLRIVWHPWI